MESVCFVQGLHTKQLLVSPQAKNPSTASFSRHLVSNDLPLFLEVPQPKATDTTTPGTAQEDPAARQQPPATGDGMGHPASLAVLRRFWVQTPPSETGAPLFACSPVAEIRQIAPLQLPEEAIQARLAEELRRQQPVQETAESRADGAGGGGALSAPVLELSAAGTSKPSGRKTTVPVAPSPPAAVVGACFQVSLASAEIRLPPSSLCVITLPSVHAAPLDWLSQVPSKTHKGVKHVEEGVTFPIIPQSPTWPYLGRVLKGTILYPCKA